MDAGMRELAEQINSMRKMLHDEMLTVGSSAKLLTLSEKLDQLILEYLRLQKAYKSS